MNTFELHLNIQGFLLFAQFFLFVNQNNPVRYLLLAMYGYMFYTYLSMDKLIDDLTMQKECLVPCLKQENNTHGQFM